MNKAELVAAVAEKTNFTKKDAEAAVTSDNLNMIVNSLKEAGAEAISINEERIVNMTDIVTVNTTVISIA